MKKSLGAQTLIYPTPNWIIGSYDENGKPNVMAAAWCGICCSKPPCAAVSLRKATYTYGCIMKRRAFTVNVPSEKYAAEADFFGIASGLTPVRSDLVDAPYVGEFPLILECRVLLVHEIGLHTQFVGEILDVKADDDLLDEKGFPDIEKVQPIIYAPTVRKYYGIGKYLGAGYNLGRNIGKK